MSEVIKLEDERGVDVSQIRRQLQMSIEDRVNYMVLVTNKLLQIRSQVKFIDPPETR